MKVKTKELLEKLNITKAGLNTKTIIKQSDHFLFTGDFIATYNDRFCIQVPFKFKQFSCPGDELLKVISGIKEEEIELDLQDKQLIIKSDSTESGLNILKSGSLLDVIKEIMLEKEKWLKLPEDFIEGVFLCMFSVSKDTSKGVLNNVSIGSNKITSSDDLRISQYNMKAAVEKKFLLPIGSVVELVKIPVIRYLIKDNWGHFKTKDGIIFSSRIFLDKFYDVEEYLDVEGPEIIFPEKTKDLINGVSVLAEGEFELDKRIKVTVDKGKIKCKGEKDKGWIEKSQTFSYKGKKLEFDINPVFFSQVIDKSSHIIIGENFALFKTDNFKHVMALPV